ncbi:MAG: lysylphosphatidylglycerol synthase transmembrane domain-containing protein [Fibrobacterota bacterium]
MANSLPVKRALLAVKVLVTLLFAGYLVGGKAVSRDGLTRAFTGADPFWLALSCVAALLALIVGTVRWHGFLNAGELSPAWSESAQSFLGGALLGLLSPGRSGEFARGMFLDGLPLKQTALITVAEKVYFTFFIFLFGAVGAFGSAGMLARILGVSAWIPVALLVLLAFQLAWIVRRGRAIRFRRLFSAMPEVPGSRLHLLSLSNLVYLLMVVQLYFILNAFQPVKMSTVFVTLSLSLIVMTFFPFSLGNLGVRESCFMALLSVLQGVPAETAVSAGLIFFVQNVLVPAGLGVPAEFIRLRKKAGSKQES